MIDLAALSLWSSALPSPWRDALASYPDALALLPHARLRELDGWYRNELTPAVQSRAPMHLTHDEMVRVTEWKMARGVWRAPNLVLVKNNPPGSVEDATSAASALLAQPAKALAAVSALKGVGPATASAALAIMAPHAFPFFDEIVAGQVSELGAVAWTATYYRKYAAALTARAESLRGVLGHEWTATHCERALWAHGVHAGARV